MRAIREPASRTSRWRGDTGKRSPEWSPNRLSQPNQRARSEATFDAVTGMKA